MADEEQTTEAETEEAPVYPLSTFNPDDKADFIRQITMIEKKNVVVFSDIFKFAEERYGVEWNDCCDIFHREEVFAYRGASDFLFDDIAEQLNLSDEDYKDGEWWKDITDEWVESEIKDDYPYPKAVKALRITAMFMKENNVEQLMVTSMQKG